MIHRDKGVAAAEECQNVAPRGCEEADVGGVRGGMGRGLGMGNRGVEGVKVVRWNYQWPEISFSSPFAQESVLMIATTRKGERPLARTRATILGICFPAILPALAGLSFTLTSLTLIFLSE